ncbi:hypothetical protein ACFQ0T_03840 [Kitasatospora gansuensis]
MNTELSEAWSLFDSGDPQGAMRALRAAADGLPSAELAPLAGRLAAAAGYDDLVEAAAALAGRPDGAAQLYDFGYACIERGVSQLAVPALRQALTVSLSRRPVGACSAAAGPAPGRCCWSWPSRWRTGSGTRRRSPCSRSTTG